MEYSKCLVELDEVLNYLVEEDLEKIPVDIRDSIKQEKSKDYKWEYDITKPLNEQNLNRKTIAMLCYLNMEYLVNEEQKKLLEEMHRFNEIKSEKEKKQKYKTEDLFTKNDENNKISKEIEIKQVQALMEVKKKSWIMKIVNLLKNFLKNN